MKNIFFLLAFISLPFWAQTPPDYTVKPEEQACQSDSDCAVVSLDCCSPGEKLTAVHKYVAAGIKNAVSKTCRNFRYEEYAKQKQAIAQERKDIESQCKAEREKTKSSFCPFMPKLSLKDMCAGKLQRFVRLKAPSCKDNVCVAQ
jgi:hypothetical protein